MIHREAAIIAAYTGIPFGSTDGYQKYVEELHGRRVSQLEMSRQEFRDKTKELARHDFFALSMENE